MVGSAVCLRSFLVTGGGGRLLGVAERSCGSERLEGSPGFDVGSGGFSSKFFGPVIWAISKTYNW